VQELKSPTIREAQQVATFRIALRSFLHRTEVVARESGLTPQRYLLLLLIKGSPRGDEQSTVGELAEAMHLGQSTVTELVNRAAQAGLVTRSSSDLDQRVAHVGLTEEGERRLALSFRALADERRSLREAIERL
jgi:DNA-binding MarR family transcriptional regulator